MPAPEITVQLLRLPEGEGLALPTYMTEDAAGADICAAVHEQITLLPGARAMIPAGFALALPAGFEAQIRPRSGLALRHGVTVLNAPGTIDADYRGPVNVILANFGNEPFVVRRGDRIAQIIIAPVSHAAFAIVENLDETQRHAGGFGSTGVSTLNTEVRS
ncbi:MAG: dUTP diphosphatase [Candidatus Eremiobacteraeota bacterium]|nr:dUTP diphosphatase [Candidatus Eremiobacteraeota bacterium]